MEKATAGNISRVKTRLFVIFLFLCVFSALSAQTRQWTLEECIRYAVEHNIIIKKIEIQKNSAEVNLNNSRMSRLPDLNAGVGQNWNFGRTQTLSGLYENRSQSNSNLSVSSSMPLFTGFRIPNEIARDKLDLQFAIQNLEKAKEDLALNIASLFLQVLFSKELLKINMEQLALSQSLIERTQFLVDAGKVPESQLYDIRAQAANDKVLLIQSENNLKLAFLGLIQGLELERNTDFDVYAPTFDDVIVENMNSIRPTEMIFDNAVQIKPAVKAQEFALESAGRTLKIARSGYWPTLSLSLGYGTNYFYLYNRDFTNRSFSEQFKNNAGEYIGLNLTVPVFNRFLVRNQVRNARFNMETQRLSMENIKKDLYKEIQTAYLNAIAALEKYKASQEAVKSASESFKYAQERYEAGKLAVFEFNEAKTKLIKNRSEAVQAKYDYIFRTKILDFYNGMPIKL
jgi:outer membrane protein